MVGLSLFLFSQKTDITFKKARNYPESPCWPWESVPQDCLQGYFRHGPQTLGWSKRVAGEVSASFGLTTRIIFFKRLLLPTPGHGSEWQLSHGATPWGRKAQSSISGCPLFSYRKTGGNDQPKLCFLCSPRRWQDSVGYETAKTSPLPCGKSHRGWS